MSIIAAGLLLFGIGVAQADNPMSDKEASPTIKERITKDTVKGTLMKTEVSTTGSRIPTAKK
jgi:hypothetical protein